MWDASGFSSGFYSVGGFPLLSQTFCTSALIWKGFADCYHPPFLGPPTSFHFCLQQPLNPILPILCSFCPPSPDWPLVSNHHPPQNFVFLGAIPSKFLQGRGLAVNCQYGPPAPLPRLGHPSPFHSSFLVLLTFTPVENQPPNVFPCLP